MNELRIETPRTRRDQLRAALHEKSETVRGDTGLTCGELRWLLDAADRAEALDAALVKLREKVRAQRSLESGMQAREVAIQHGGRDTGWPTVGDLWSAKTAAREVVALMGGE